MKEKIIIISLVFLSLIVVGIIIIPKLKGEKDNMNIQNNIKNKNIEFDLEKKEVVLNNGVSMPIIGLGTWTLSNEEAERCTYEAIKAGKVPVRPKCSGLPISVMPKFIHRITNEGKFICDDIRKEQR